MKITIITATLNSAATVRDTIESILRQTHQDWELIIEDGLSKDGTLDVVREYEPRCKGRMRIFSEKDEGIYDSMNRAIARATGDVIGILNSDDFYHDEYVLEDINRAMDGKPVDCVYGDLKFVKADETSRVMRIWKGSQHEAGAFLRGWHPAHPTFYVRRECFEQLGGFNISFAVSADFELMLRFIEVAGLRNQYIPRFFVMMRLGGESTRSLRNIIRGNRGILRALRQNGFRPSTMLILRRILPKVWAAAKGRLQPLCIDIEPFGTMGIPSDKPTAYATDFIVDGMAGYERCVKRVFDLLISAVSLLLFSPLMIIIYIIIKLENDGPAIFKQERLGRFGRPFNIYKFRSMCLDAEESGPMLSHANGNDDPRLTKVGKYLRAHHLDELPQLWNIFIGDMSLIGYRPERKFYIDQIMKNDPRYAFLYQIRPGITSYATLYNGYTDTMEKMLRRLELDLYYLGHRSWLMDLKILVLTFLKIIFGKTF